MGPTRTLTTPSAAAAVVSDGDIVEIDADTYNNDYATWTANNLTLRAVGGKAHLHSSIDLTGLLLLAMMSFLVSLKGSRCHAVVGGNGRR